MIKGGGVPKISKKPVSLSNLTDVQCKTFYVIWIDLLENPTILPHFRSKTRSLSCLETKDCILLLVEMIENKVIILPLWTENETMAWVDEKPDHWFDDRYELIHATKSIHHSSFVWYSSGAPYDGESFIVRNKTLLRP